MTTPPYRAGATTPRLGWNQHVAIDDDVATASQKPSDDDASDVEEIDARIVGKIRRLLARRDGDAVDDEPDALAYAQTEAVLPMSLAEPPPRFSASRRRCAFIDGFSLHADTSVDAAWPRRLATIGSRRLPGIALTSLGVHL